MSAFNRGGESESASATSIKYKIKKLVDQEDPNSPVSDDLIVSTLAKDGVSVARRTVAKYRKMESIPVLLSHVSAETFYQALFKVYSTILFIKLA